MLYRYNHSLNPEKTLFKFILIVIQGPVSKFFTYVPLNEGSNIILIVDQLGLPGKFYRQLWDGQKVPQKKSQDPEKLYYEYQT